MVNNNDFCFAFTPGEELTSRCFSFHVLETGCKTTEEQQSFVYLLLLMKQQEMLVQMLVHLRRLISVCHCAADEHVRRYCTPCSRRPPDEGKAAVPVMLCPGEQQALQIPARICRRSSCPGLGACSFPSWRDAIECQSCSCYSCSAESGSHSFGHHKIPFHLLPQASVQLKCCLRWAVTETSHLAGAWSLTNGSGETL